MNNLNKILLGVHVTLVLTTCLFYSQDNTVYAQTRNQVEEIKNNIDQAEKEILILDDRIKSQQNTIREKESLIDIAKGELRNIKSKLNSSWDSYLDVDDAQKKVNDAINNLLFEKDKLGEFITERSNHFKFINENKNIEIKREPFDGTGLTKLVGVELSKTCLISYSCPSYSDLYTLDSSIENMTGNFIYDDTKGFHRGPSPVENPWRLYDNDDTIRIIIDPPNGMAERIKMITIVPSLDNYTIQTDMVQNNSRVLFHDRYVDDCKRATLSAKVWEMVLPITIFDLRNGCIDSEFTERQVINFTKSEIDITTSPNWQAEQKLKADLIRCKVKC